MKVENKYRTRAFFCHLQPAFATQSHSALSSQVPQSTMDAASMLSFPSPDEESPQEQATAAQRLAVSLGTLGQRAAISFCFTLFHTALC